MEGVRGAATDRIIVNFIPAKGAFDLDILPVVPALTEQAASKGKGAPDMISGMESQTH